MIQHFEINLGENLVLRSVRDERDIERYAAFNVACNNPFEGATAKCLLHHHPYTNLADYWMVEDLSNGEVASTTCLLPWRARFGSVELNLAQLEMVLTHPAYRKRGLVRAQIEHFKREVQRRKFDFSVIWGIPYYYRQFGYSYAIDSDLIDCLPVYSIPDSWPGSGPACRIRKAQAADIPTLSGLYDNQSRALDLSIIRLSRYWEYLLQDAHHPFHIFEDENGGDPPGYASFLLRGKTAWIQQSAFISTGASFAFLKALKYNYPDIEKIEILGSEISALKQAARSLGSEQQTGGQLLVRIHDLPGFLNRITPVLNARLERSSWHGVTTKLILNLYHEAFELLFENGQFAGVRPLGFVDYSMGAEGGDLCIPPDAFTRLAVGYRTLDQLSDAWPDIVVRPEARLLSETLFPRMTSTLEMPYHDLGHLEP